MLLFVSWIVMSCNNWLHKILLYLSYLFHFSILRVFRTMFQEGASDKRLSSPVGRRRLNSSGSRLTNSISNSTSSPQLLRKNYRMQPSPQKSKLISAVNLQKKKKHSPDTCSIERSISTSPEPKPASPFFEEPRQPIHEQVQDYMYITTCLRYDCVVS